MDEILQKLLQSELLSEDTKTELSEQWTKSVRSFKAKVREEVSLTVRAELAEQWITERDALVAKVDDFVTDALQEEVQELKGDIERFRDLEAEYAEKLVEEKYLLAEQVASELDQLVDKIDVFFEVRLGAELEELKEDMEVVKQNEFGRKIYEAYASTFAEAHIDDDSITSKLQVAEAKVQDLQRTLASSEQNRHNMVREAKLEKILGNLIGKKREQMEMVLKNIETGKLEESYKFFIGRIMKEDVRVSTRSSLSEAFSGRKTTVVTGDAPVEPAVAKTELSESLVKLQRLAGIK